MFAESEEEEEEISEEISEDVTPIPTPSDGGTLQSIPKEITQLT
jgi:hypothetical protein